MKKKWTFVGATAVVVLSYYLIRRNTNNVCKSFEDYYSDRDSNENCYYNPDYKLNATEIIQRHGYPVETHYATTKDGYIVALFRIPHGIIGKKEQRQPVLLQHGIAQNSDSFISTGNKSLGFILANAGYDVWLGNFRGTQYSRKHVMLSDEDREYWDFSIDEMGLYDLRAEIDLINKITAQKVIYVGYSMGTITSFIYSSTYTDVPEKLKIIIGMAPVAMFKEWKSITGYLLRLLPYFQPVVDLFTNGVFYVRSLPPHSIRYWACLPFPFQMRLCQFIDMLACGFNYEQSDPETLPITLLLNSDATSVKNLNHIGQLLKSKLFQRFNYGVDNAKVYGNKTPLEYDLSKVNVPVYLIRSDNDPMATEENVRELNASLSERVKSHDIYVVKNKSFNHADFTTAKDVVPLLYNHLLKIIRSIQ